jgi:uncharacterized protein YndB with AHSA1/START domain
MSPPLLVQVVREFQAAAEEVFDAWRDPTFIAHWTQYTARAPRKPFAWGPRLIRCESS